MQYKVLPFEAALNQGGTLTDAANQLQVMIQHESDQGWEFVAVNHVDSRVAGNSGCFGFGSTPASNFMFTVVVFRK